VNSFTTGKEYFCGTVSIEISGLNAFFVPFGTICENPVLSSLPAPSHSTRRSIARILGSVAKRGLAATADLKVAAAWFVRPSTS
jgi:hypothetical protein